MSFSCAYKSHKRRVLQSLQRIFCNECNIKFWMKIWRFNIYVDNIFFLNQILVKCHAWTFSFYNYQTLRIWIFWLMVISHTKFIYHIIIVNKAYMSCGFAKNSEIRQLPCFLLLNRSKQIGHKVGQVDPNWDDSGSF